MRLIDADMLKKYMLDNSKETERFLQYVDEQSTVYDVDKVINELKRDKFIDSECILSDAHQGYNAGLSRAIEIVKGGGVNA